MAVVVFLLGVLQIVGGAGVFRQAQSAIHEILGTLAIGTGILSIALAAVIWHLGAIRRQLKALDELARRAPEPAPVNAAREPMSADPASTEDKFRSRAR